MGAFEYKIKKYHEKVENEQIMRKKTQKGKIANPFTVSWPAFGCQPALRSTLLITKMFFFFFQLKRKKMPKEEKSQKEYMEQLLGEHSTLERVKICNPFFRSLRKPKQS